jgi:hypothetical protein
MITKIIYPKDQYKTGFEKIDDCASIDESEVPCEPIVEGIINSVTA